MEKIIKQSMNEKSRIEEVVGYYISLHRGSKSGKTLETDCPFHIDKRNSFKVNLTKQTYECKICKEKGDAVHFIQDMEGCSEIEALTVYAKWNKLTENGFNHYLKPKLLNPEDKAFPSSLPVSVPKDYKLILESLNPYKAEDTQFAHVYKYLGIGIAPDSMPDLYKGLSNRQVFPHYNKVGIVEGFLGIEENANENIYTCVPDSLISNHLFGLYRAIESLHGQKLMYLVWSIQDLVFMIAAGFKNVVACLDDTLSMEKIGLLSNSVNEVVIVSTGKVAEQVKATKTIAKLSRVSIIGSHFILFDKISLQYLYQKLDRESIEYYIRQGTRISRLNMLGKTLNQEIVRCLDYIENAESMEERVKYRMHQQDIGCKLDKINRIVEVYSKDLQNMLEQRVINR